MTEVNTSMYPQPGAAQNPLQALSTLVGIRNSNIAAQGQMIQNQGAMRSLNAQQAVGNAIQNATGQDGSFDPNAFMGIVKSDPAAAYGAQEAQNFAQAQRAAQLQVAIVKQDRLNSVLGATLDAATNEDGSFNETKLTPDLISGQVGELVKDGVLDAKTAASELASMPVDPGQRYQWLKGHLAQGLAAQGQIQAAYGSLIQNDNGQQILTNRVPEMGGTLAPIQKQISPETAATPVAGPVTPEGAPTTVPLGQRVGMGQVTTGLSPAGSAAQSVTGQGNAQQGLALQTQANEAPQIKAILGHMQGDLKYFQSGPGSAEWKHLLAAGVSLGLPVSKNAVASQENFTKFGIMLAQRTGQMFGGNGSDQRWLGAVESNPNQALSNEGNRRIINILKGNIDAVAAANKGWQAWQEQGHGGETFGQYMQQFNSKIDPRFFQMQYMTPQERQRMMQGMDQSEQQQFNAKLKAAKAKGWVPE